MKSGREPATRAGHPGRGRPVQKRASRGVEEPGGLPDTARLPRGKADTGTFSSSPLKHRYGGRPGLHFHTALTIVYYDDHIASLCETPTG